MRKPLRAGHFSAFCDHHTNEINQSSPMTRIGRFLLLLALLLPFAVQAKPRVRRVCEHSLCTVRPDHHDNTGQRVTHNVFIGNQYAAANAAWLRSEGIDHVISLIGEPHARLPHIHYLVFDLDDDSTQNMVDVIFQVHDYIKRRIRGKAKVLVHCAAGVSRSATTVIGHLLLSHPSLSLHAAEKRVRAVRPVIQPNNNFEHQLRKLEKARVKK